MPDVPVKTCQHCGSPIIDDRASLGFCCQGCAHVHAVIIENGLGKYYELRDVRTTPIRPTSLEPRDFSWLTEAVAAAERSAMEGITSLNLGIQGISCVACVWLIEKLYMRRSGAVRAGISPQEGSIRLEWLPGKIDLPDFARELQNVGYILGTAGERPASETRGLAMRIGLCGAFAMNGMLHILPFYLGMGEAGSPAPIFRLLSVFFATMAMLVGGSYFINRAWRSLRVKVLHIDLPIALGILAAYIGSFAGWFLRNPSLEYWDFISLFIFLMLTGRWLQERAVERNRLRLLALNPRPEHIQLYASSLAESSIPIRVEQIAPENIIGIAPGQAVPVCAMLINNPEGLSLEWINGEAEPRVFLPGAVVPAGAVNISRHEIKLVARETWRDSLLFRLLTTREEKPFRNYLLEQTLASYLTSILLVATLGLLGWGFGTHDWAAALQVFISILVVSCPCTIGLAFPLATELAVTRLRTLGIHVRDNSLWERLRKVHTIVFDKTGTLTLETPTLKNPEALEKLSSKERTRLFQIVENSLHPTSRCIRETLLGHPESRQRISANPDDKIEETVAAGMTLHAADGTQWQLGKPAWISGKTESSPADSIFACNGAILTSFQIQESIRPGTIAAVATLEKYRRPVYILSGDRQEKVSAMLAALHLSSERGLASLSPQQKADWIKTHAAGKALMIGDGANDALAFSQAICRGTPVIDKGLLEKQSDFYLMGQSLEGIIHLLDMAAYRRRVLFAVFTFAVIYNVGTVGICLAGKMNPLLAAILMPSSALVTLAAVTLAFRIKSRQFL